jgi:hypothetical protein
MNAGWTTQEASRHLLPYFVSLGCKCKRPQDDTPNYFNASGFLVEIEGSSFFVTAGHVLASIEDAQRKGVAFCEWRLDDTASDHVRTKCSLPFDFSQAPKKYVEHSSGADYGIIALRPYYVDALRKHGALFCSHELLDDTPFRESLEDPVQFFLVGVTAESLALIGGPMDNICKTAWTVQLIPEPSPPPNVSKYVCWRRVPDQPDAERIEDMAGLSGGPIFAVKFDGDRTPLIALVAIQRGWIRPDLVTSVLAVVLAATLQSAIREARTEVTEHS